MKAIQIRRGIAMVRVGVGVGALLAPHQTGRVFAMDMASNVGAPFFARLYGARQIFMAAPVLVETGAVDQDTLARWSTAVDLADTAAALAAATKGYLPARAVAMSGAMSVLCAVAGSLSLRQSAADESIASSTNRVP